MRLAAAITFAVVIVAGVVAFAQTRKIDFEQDAAGQPPSAFTFALTRKTGSPGRWLVQHDTAGKYLAQLRADNTSARFPIAVLADLSSADVDLSVQFRPVSGRVDQAGGLVWRFQDENRYYVVRANALEDNVVLYKVQDGRRTDLPVRGEGRTYGKKADVAAGRWSTLRVVARGPLFEVFLNGIKLFEVEDTTFTRSGAVGVWTKADSITHFDNLTVATPAVP
jgi:hypothetical protein